MGTLLLSAVLIFVILTISYEKFEIQIKIIIGFCSSVLIAIILYAFTINIILYLIAALIVGCWLSYATNYFCYSNSKKYFLPVVCILTFLSINAWGIIGSFVLCSCFDYGIVHGFHKGFTEMNSSFDFTMEVMSNILLKSETSAASAELVAIKEQLSPELNKIEVLQMLVKLLEYL